MAKLTPFADAFVEFQTALTEVSETAKAFAKNTNADTRDAHHKAYVTCLAIYNRVLTQVQDAQQEIDKKLARGLQAVIDAQAKRKGFTMRDKRAN